MSKFLLYLIMLPSGLWRSMGADVIQLRAILHTKLLVDNRKPLSFGNNKGVEHKKKDRKYTTLLTMLFSLVMGIIYTLPIGMTYLNATIGLSLFYTMFIFLLTFTLVTDFANVLIDTKDKFILFSRPVSDGTIMLSRMLYIFIYMMRVVIPMTIPAWILFTVIKGWKGFLFLPVSVVLMVFVVLFIVCALYILMVQLAGAKRFKDVLNYFQIGFSIIFFAVWMLSSRSINPDAIEGIKLESFAWMKFTPPYWMSVCWAWIDSKAPLLAGTSWTGALAIILPFIGLWATIKFLAPQFIKKLVAADNDADVIVAQPQSAKQRSAKPQKGLMRRAAMFNKTNEGQAGFIITWLQTNRSRTFKMRVLPSFAYVPVYFFYMLSQGGGSLTSVWNSMADGHAYVALLYMTTFVIMQAINYITMSENYKAAWVYYAAPVDKPGEVIVGAYKAMWVKYYLPFMMAIALFCIGIWGPKVLPDILLATANTTLFTVAIMRISYRHLPFSKKEQMKDSGFKSVVRVLGTLLLMGILGVSHYAIAGIATPGSTRMSFDMSGVFNPTWLTIISLSLKLVLLTLSSIFLWLLLDSLRNTTWQGLHKTEELI